MCPAQTSGSLNHPLRSSSESICVGQLVVQCVCVRVGPLSACPRAVSAHSPRSHAGQPSEPTLTGLQPHCSTAHNTPGHTLQEREGERESGVYSASLRQDRELMGHFTLYNMAIFQLADLMIHQSMILTVTVFTRTGNSWDYINPSY